MRRFLAVSLAVCVAAVAACNQQAPPRSTADAEEEAVPPPPPGVANVTVFCDDAEGGVGARVNPWRLHTGRDSVVTFNIHPTPGSFGVSTTLDSVPGLLWAFRAPVYGPNTTGAITAPLHDSTSLSEGDITYYRLTLTCRPTAGVAEGNVIVIDPIVIVDNPPPPGPNG